MELNIWQQDIVSEIIPNLILLHFLWLIGKIYLRCWEQRLNYLHENPVRSGTVAYASHYKYSSAVDYHEERAGLLPIRLL